MLTSKQIIDYPVKLTPELITELVTFLIHRVLSAALILLLGLSKEKVNSLSRHSLRVSKVKKAIPE